VANSLKQHIRIAKRNTKITPKLHGWLNANDGIHVDNAEVMRTVMQILAPPKGDRSGVFHPSQLYQCQRYQLFDFHGLDTEGSYNPTLQNLFNDGHFRHLRWQIMLLNAGILTDVEVPISRSDLRLSGSMDGLNKDEGWMFELKGTSQYQQVMKRGIMPAHTKQVNAYLLASGLDTALVVYECKQSQQWTEFEITRDEKIIGEIEAILESLNNALDNNVMPEVLDDCKNKTGTTYSNCAHREVCGRVRETSDIDPFIPIRRRSADSKPDA
jgi:hypothetical protein